MVLYAKKVGIHRPKMGDQKLTEECEKALKDAGVPRNDTKNMRTAGSNEDVEHSLHTLGSGVHGGHLPSRKALIRIWQNWRTPVTAMLASL